MSRVNRQAIRGPRGYWNEHSLNLTEWEDPAFRIVVPESLQVAVGLETPVLRWVAHKRLEVFAKHSEVIDLDFSDGVFWEHWFLAGPEPTMRKAINVFWEHEGNIFSRQFRNTLEHRRSLRSFARGRAGWTFDWMQERQTG
jgi:hypothetical protein